MGRIQKVVQQNLLKDHFHFLEYAMEKFRINPIIGGIRLHYPLYQKFTQKTTEFTISSINCTKDKLIITITLFIAKTSMMKPKMELDES